MPSQHQFKNKEETRFWVQKFAALLPRPCVVRLDGEMGAGKTHLVRWILEALGDKNEAVASPTFALHHVYSSSSGPIDHIDLYRLSSEEELESSGFWDLFLQDQGLILVEWAKRVPEGSWPAHYHNISVLVRRVDEFSDEADERREITLKTKPPTTNV